MSKEATTIKSLLPFLRQHPWTMALIIVLGLLSSLAEGLGISLFVPFLQGVIQEGQLPQTNNMLIDWLAQLFNNIPADQRLLFIGIAIFAAILLKAALAYSSDILFAWLNNGISHDLRSRIFKQLLRINYSYIQNSESGKLLNILSNETWRTTQALGVFVYLIINVCALIVYTILLLLISWQLTILVAVVMAAISFAMRFLMRRVEHLGQEATQANAALADRMLEGLWAMKAIRAFSREPHEQERFDKTSKRVSKAFLDLAILNQAVSPIYEILAVAVLVVIMLFTLRNPENFAVFLVFLVLLYRLQPKIKTIDSSRIALLSLAAGVKEVTSLLDPADKPYTLSGKLPFKGVKQAITFDKVSFRYSTSDRAALQDISVTLPAGKTTALVGPSGAGKSTLVNLLFRFYDPSSGVISVDGEPLGNLELTSWRERIALVSQDVYIFGSTLRENIAYGRLNATDEEVVEAAVRANAHDFIRQLPQGYDSKVGDRGIRLSGGQQQRIALARAIIRNPEVLILDEATNALDSISEHLVQETLDSFGKGRTVIVIAHRLSTIERADNIIVLENGRVREQGNLQQLLQLDGLFTQLYELQYRGALMGEA